MIFDISNADVFIISLNPYSEKYRKLVDSLVAQDVPKERIAAVQGVRQENATQGVALAHIRALAGSLISLNRGSHSLVLEEDAVINKKNTFNKVFSLPDDAEMLYLGWSSKKYEHEKNKWRIPNKFPFNLEPRPARVVPSGDGIYQICDFLTAHAIAYLTSNAVSLAIESIFSCIENGFVAPQDMSRAALQRVVPTYAPEFTQFIQVEHRPEKQYINDEMVNTVWEGAD